MTIAKKIPSWLTVLIMSGLGISISPHQVMTRTAEISRALSPVLSSYEVIRMEPGAIERQVRTTGELRFRFKETDFYFNLEPHDMRAPNYRAVETGPGGVKRTLPPQPVHTFRGVLAGREDIQGRFNLTDGGVEGVVYAPEGWVYVEPLRNYLPDAPSGELVVYKHTDLKLGVDLQCGVSLPKRLQRGVNRVASEVRAASSTIPTKYEFDIATEADYEYVQALGGSEEAIREIEGILNQVEGVYQSELLLQLRISFQHAWGMEDDPYTTTDSSDLLDEFAGYWNTHYAAEADYDVAHLWTAKELDYAGRARQSVVCNARSRSYSLSTRFPRPINYIIAAHEIGHNFGAVHPDQQSPPVAACSETIMQAAASAGTGLTFCEFSRQEIATHLESNNSCLTTLPITIQPPADLTASARSSSEVNLLWRDNSTNETGFRVQRRLDGSGAWNEIGVTAANATSYSDGGLFPRDTYHYRVRAFNDTESSAFSNEATATTLEGPVTGDQWRIDTIAGGGLGDNGPAVEARLRTPRAIALDGAGNLYIADASNNRIRRVDPKGIITTVAGIGSEGIDGPSFGGDGGPAVAAQLRHPQGVTVDDTGNLYIADSYNNRIRRVDASGTITTVAGTGERGYSGDGGPAVRAKLFGPASIAVDGAGNLFIADSDNNRIRRVDAAGIITTVAGTGEYAYSGDGGPAIQAGIRFPQGVAVDGAGNLYIADTWNHRIRRVDASGTITTVAGTEERGYSGDGGPAIQAQLDAPNQIAVDSAGNFFISVGHRVRRVDASGTITTVAGTGDEGYSGDGGPAVQARLRFPHGLAVDGDGNLFIGEWWDGHIRRVDPSGIITTIAGGGSGGDGGPAVEARLNRPSKVTLDLAGNLFVADSSSHRVRRVDATGTITTVAGTGETGYSGDGGPAVHAKLNEPSDVAFDRAGNLFIADSGNHRVRRVDTSGIITTITTELYYPRGLAMDGAGNIFIADTDNHRIRKMDRSGTITTVAGTGRNGYSGDNGPAVAAQLAWPRGVALDGSGNLLIADSWNNSIRRVDATGTISTIAGIGVAGFGGDGGPATGAALHIPYGVAADGAGNLFIADSGNHRVRHVDSSGTTTTIAGPRKNVQFPGGFGGDGGLAIDAYIRFPEGLALDGSGNLYIADTDNDRIRVLTQPPRPPSAPTRLRATAVSVDAINLAWQDNSTNETGFTVQRRVDGTARWVEIATTAANATTFLDSGLKPTTTYHYRVRAFNNSGASAFSNEAMATTQRAFPPTLTRFNPTSGPVGVQVTITGTHFLGATAVEFNGVPAARFEVVSGTSIKAVVPSGATSGPISVETPGGTAVSADPFTVIDSGIRSRLFVPIVLRSQGRTAGSFFTSELTLTNRGSSTAAIQYTYTAAFGGGSGTAVDSLEPGQQRIIPDTIAYLTSLGVPIGEGAARGTLVVDFSNLSSPSDAAVTVRVSTPVEEGRGRAGLAYLGLNPDGLLTGPAFITGLRQNSQDRSNVAVQNAGDANEGIITLRVTVFSGDSASAGRSEVLPDRTLPPGGFYQYNGILREAGFDIGYAKVERVNGKAPFYAYGVINDNFNSDGSFVFPVREDSLAGKRGQTLPVIIETGDFTSELTVTNFSSVPKTVDFRFVAEAVETDDETASFSLKLKAGEQQILPQVVDWLRQQEVAGIGAADEPFVGAVFATVAEGDMSGIVMGARTGAPDKRGGQYGLFYNGVPDGSASTMSAWIYGLQQNEENRSNLALVNTGEVDDSDSTIEIDIYDGDGDSQPRTKSITLGPRRWSQINGILGATSQGYVQVRKTMGNNPFVAYGVVNDGGARGERSGDGAYLPAHE